MAPMDYATDQPLDWLRDVVNIEKNVWPKADMPDFQQGRFVWFAERE
jgi:hypothetical protein